MTRKTFRNYEIEKRNGAQFAPYTHLHQIRIEGPDPHTLRTYPGRRAPDQDCGINPEATAAICFAARPLMVPPE